MEKKYMVAEGRAVTAQGVVFGPGAVLPAEALSAESVSVLLKGKFIVEAEAPAQAEKTAKEGVAPKAAPVEEKKAEAEAPAQAEKTAKEEAAPEGDDKKRK